MVRLRPELLVLLWACGKQDQGVGVPRATEPVTCDGKIDDAVWRGAARTSFFHNAQGREANAASMAMFLHDDRYLYLTLYAGDTNVRSSDAFEVDLSPRGPKLRFTADGKPPRPDVLVGVDLDGTLDDTKEDEEWVVEAAVPRALLGGDRVPIVISRCDPDYGPSACGRWQGTLVMR